MMHFIKSYYGVKFLYYSSKKYANKVLDLHLRKNNQEDVTGMVSLKLNETEETIKQRSRKIILKN